MKSLFNLTLLSLLLFACNQEETNPVDTVEPYIGVWESVEVCGGFAGICTPMNDEGFHTVEFTEEGRYVYAEDGMISSDFAFNILETIDVEPDGTQYQIEFVDEYDTHMTLFDDDRLQIIGGDFYIEYER